MISSIINRQLLTPKDHINFLFTRMDSELFGHFIKKNFNCSLINFDQMYYGQNDIDVILCNNRILHLDKCIELSKFFHCPLIVIDHDKKPKILSNIPEIEKTFYPQYQVAVSEEVFISWNKIQDHIMGYSLNNEQSKNSWKNLVFQLCKQPFLIKEVVTEDG